MNSKLLAMVRLDLAGLRPAVRSMATLVAVALVAGIGFKQFAVAMSMLGVPFVILPMNLFAADESFRLRELYGALPLRRSIVINSRYLISTLALAVSVVLVLVVVLGTGQFREPGMLLVPIWVGIVLSLCPAVQLPMAIRFGPRRAVWVVVVPFAMVLVAGMVITSSLDLMARLAPLAAWAVGHPGLVTGLGVLGAAGLMTASWLISQRIYAAQDH